MQQFFYPQRVGIIGVADTPSIFGKDIKCHYRGAYKISEKINFRDETLPKTTLEKVRRRELS